MVSLIQGVQKDDANEFIYKTETDSQTQKTFMVTKGERGRDKVGDWDKQVYNYL